jgi:hypothetical protein
MMWMWNQQARILIAALPKQPTTFLLGIAKWSVDLGLMTHLYSYNMKWYCLLQLTKGRRKNQTKCFPFTISKVNRISHCNFKHFICLFQHISDWNVWWV